MPWGDLPTAWYKTLDLVRDWWDARDERQLQQAIDDLENESWLKQRQAAMGLASAADMDAIHEQLRQLQRRAAAKRARSRLRQGDPPER